MYTYIQVTYLIRHIGFVLLQCNQALDLKVGYLTCTQATEERSCDDDRFLIPVHTK